MGIPALSMYEKIVKGLTCHIQQTSDACAECPYYCLRDKTGQYNYPWIPCHSALLEDEALFKKHYLSLPENIYTNKEEHL